MNYKIVKVQEVDAPVYFENLYKKNFINKSKNYKYQHNEIQDHYIGYSPKSFLKIFNEMGNDADIIFWNAEVLQKKWAEENGISFQNQNWRTDILLAQLKKKKPEVLFLQNISSMSKNIRKDIKKLVPSIKKVVINVGYPGTWADLSDADLFFTNSPVLSERYKYLKPYLIYHSFDHMILNSSSFIGLEKKYELSFVGSLRFPESRYFFIKRLNESFDLNIWSNPELNKKLKIEKKEKDNIFSIKQLIIELFKSILKTKIIKKLILLINPKKINYKILEFFNLQSLKKQKKILIPNISTEDIENENFSFFKNKNFSRGVYGLEYFKILKQSRILVNKHADYAGIIVDNIKMFEITGIGSCLVTNYGSNLKNIFEEDKEVITYKNMNEAEDKIKFLINNPKVAEEVARNGQKKTLSKHTTNQRNIEMERVIRKSF